MSRSQRKPFENHQDDKHRQGRCTCQRCIEDRKHKANRNQAQANESLREWEREDG